MRERLIEIMERANEHCCNGPCNNCKYDEDGKYCKVRLYADHLLENGVIVPPCEEEEQALRGEG